jgi:hypothetical protein
MRCGVRSCPFNRILWALSRLKVRPPKRPGDPEISLMNSSTPYLGSWVRIHAGERFYCSLSALDCTARTMVIADELLEVLKNWRQRTQFSEPEDWVFASPVKLGRQPLSYTYVWETLGDAATRAGIGHISSHTFRHTYRTWLDSVGTPIGVQQKLMRHADIRTTMNIYGDAPTEDMRSAHEKVVRRALPKTM